MTVIAIPKILRDRLTDEGAEALVQILDKVEDRTQKVTLEIAEERFEKKLESVKSELKIEITALRTEIARSKSRLTKWMFVFWVGQLGAMMAILFTFFKK